MLRLTANDTTLDLSNVSFNLTLRSPIAGNSGSYVYSVTLPLTPNNAAAFGFPYRLQRRNKSRATATGKIWWNNRVIQRGVWQAKTTGSETISLQMLISAGIFADSIAGKNLPELFDKAVTVADIVSHLESQVQRSWPDVEYNFPTIYNPQFYGDPKETDPDKNKNPQFEGFINNYKNGFVPNDTANRNTISPQLYLAYMVKHIFASQGYTVQGTPLTEEMFSRALIYNNFALDKLLATTFHGEFAGATASPDFPVLWNDNLNDPGNLYNASTGEYTAQNAGEYQLTIPVTYTSVYDTDKDNYEYFLTVEYNGVVIATQVDLCKDNDQHSFELKINHTITEEEAGKTFLIKSYLDDGTGTKSSVTINNASIDIINNTQPLINILRGDFNYKDLVPDMPVKDFLKSVYQGFGMLPFFNEQTKTLTLVSWAELLTKAQCSDLLKNGLHRHSLKITANNYQGITASFNFTGTDDFSNDGKEIENKGTVMKIIDIPEGNEGDVYYVTNLNAFYQRKYNKDIGLYDQIPVGDLNPTTVKDRGKQPMSFSLSPMKMRSPYNLNYFHRNLPAISAQGTSTAYNIRNSFPLRVMFWVGITDPISGGGYTQYPLASTTKYDTLGNIVLPINWKTADILTRYYAEWQTWLQRREKVDLTQEISSADLSLLDFQKAYYFQYALLLLEESYTRLKNHEFGPAKLKGWTM